MISKGQGMVIHTHDCPVIGKTRPDPDRLLDVQWDQETRKSFEVSIKLVVANQRGVLAKVAAEISSAGSNIQNVSVDPEDGGTYTGMHFTLQVANRLHLAHIMRALRGIPEVIRISRVKTG
jgi:GTP pyrophosphokinase